MLTFEIILKRMEEMTVSEGSLQRAAPATESMNEGKEGVNMAGDGATSLPPSNDNDNENTNADIDSRPSPDVELPPPETHSSTIVIKVGTSSLLRPNADPPCLWLSQLSRVCEVAADLTSNGHRVCIVTSGAVGVGCQLLGLRNKPQDVAQKQALAAVGQQHLMRYYDEIFSALGRKCGQVLLTLDNVAKRNSYLNAQNTFRELFNFGVMPIVNENDTVATEQIRFGDNDTLSAQVANLISADWLFLLTDVDYLYTGNPRLDPDASPIFVVEDVSQLEVNTQTRGTQWGTGGMKTKITAAVMASASGCKTVICSSATPESLTETISGNWQGTVFLAQDHPVRGRRRWVLLVPPKGKIVLDSGAVRAVIKKRSSLFAAGIVSVEGNFSYQDAVQICSEDGKELARGLVNYSSQEIDMIKGKNSRHINRILGYVGPDEVVIRDNISIVQIPTEDDHMLDDDNTDTNSTNSDKEVMNNNDRRRGRTLVHTVRTRRMVHSESAPMLNHASGNLSNNRSLFNLDVSDVDESHDSEDM